MADNIAVSPGSGATVAADDIGGVHYQRVKVTHGADGSATDTSSTNPLPVSGPATNTELRASALQVEARDGFEPVGSPFSVTSAAVLFSQETTGFQSIVVQVTSPGTACTLTYEQSNDNATWVVVFGFTSAGAAFSTSSGAALYESPLWGRYVRVRVSTYGSGTVTVVPRLLSQPLSSPYVTLTSSSFAIPSGTSATLNNTTARVHSAATTNATAVKTSVANLYNLSLFNTSASVKYFKLYNKASAPTVGTDTPLITIPIPAGGRVDFSRTIPDRFATGLAYAITGALADTDTTAVAAGDVTGAITYS